MNERRLLAEGELLSFRFPGVRVGVDPQAGTGWCFIPNFSLPAGWSQSSSNLLIMVPAGYPMVPPDKFFIERGLRDARGRSVGHYFEEQGGYNPYAGRGWAWFCYHIRSGAWRSTARPLDGDSLLTYANVIYQALQGVLTGS
jgi:hypothetical protein